MNCVEPGCMGTNSGARGRLGGLGSLSSRGRMSFFVVFCCLALDSNGKVANTSSRFSMPPLLVLVKGAVLRRLFRLKRGVRVSAFDVPFTV